MSNNNSPSNFRQRKIEYDRIADEGILPMPEIFSQIHDDDEFRVRDIADLLHKSEETIRRWIRTGQLTSFSPGHYYITGRELKRFLFAKSNVR